ncbi:MAG: zinc-ribbon domain containing protein, partial [Candidatus Kerfeldbacteria bacterium]|nr:zinc-ribbon domain containing protein [Candidatus Kerfeldbacteria bacterium]
MATINKTCVSCSGQFTITAADEEFYSKVQAPSPKTCPRCRMQRRFAYRNERALFAGTCAQCQKNILSLYQPTDGLTVYCQTCWWGDDWDPVDFGQAIDWNRSFLEQYQEVRRRVPRLALVAMNSDNSDYTNMCADNKNCYLLFASENCENCSYGKLVQKCKDSFDNCFLYDSELCYECINCRNCFQCTYVKDSQDSRESHYSLGLKGCSNVFLCSDLHNKEYYIKNKPVPAADYAKQVAELLKDRNHCYQEWLQLAKGRVVK